MLRLPPFRYHRPETAAQAASLLAEYEGDAIPVAGGTDLIPNMKHGLFAPGHLVALKGIEALKGIREEGGQLVIGAAETLTSVATHPLVGLHFTSLSLAAGHVAGPQHRNAGTIGGNLCLDTRCTYYNQSRFWRKSLGYCLKKDGDVCHVTKVGKKCVAAHSADTPPVLITLGAVAELVGPAGARSVPVEDFFVADGIWNSVRQPDEIVTRIRIPLPGKEDGSGKGGGGVNGSANGNATTLRTAYQKLRQRNSIDFPLLTVALAARLDGESRVHSIRGVVTGLGSRPRELTGWSEIAEGELLSEEVVDALAERAHRQCRPLDNMTIDADWRRAMVPVYVKRALADLDGVAAVR